MDYFLNKYRVPSARAVWHRYEAGTYFVTICTKGKVHHFGRVVDGEMEYTALGRAAVACWEAVPRHFPHVEVICFVVMPNHVHAVLRVNDTDDAADDPQADTAADNGTPEQPAPDTAEGNAPFYHPAPMRPRPSPRSSTTPRRAGAAVRSGEISRRWCADLRWA